MISVSRKPLGLQNPKMKEVIISDFFHLLDYKDDLRGDIYFCALGTTKKDAGSEENFRKIDYEAIINFGIIAKYHEAKSLSVISASMADEKSKIFYNKIKGETEKALINISLNRLIIFRPGLLIGDRTNKRSGEEFAIKFITVLSTVIPTAIEKRLATNIEILASRMILESQRQKKELMIIEAKDI